MPKLNCDFGLKQSWSVQSLRSEQRKNVTQVRAIERNFNQWEQRTVLLSCQLLRFLFGKIFKFIKRLMVSQTKWLGDQDELRLMFFFPYYIVYGLKSTIFSWEFLIAPRKLPQNHQPPRSLNLHFKKSSDPLFSGCTIRHPQQQLYE